MHEDEEEDEPSRWAWLGTKRVAAVILILLAAEIGYVVHLNTQGASNKSATPPTTQATVPAPTPAPNLQVPVVVPTTVPPTTVPHVTPTTVAKPKPAPAVAAVQAAPLAPCTTGDLNVVTRESGTAAPSGAFLLGQPIMFTTTVSAVRSCIFQPAAVGTQNCATWVVVNALDGPNPGQAFPNATNAESCNPPAGQTMNAGSSESISITFTPPSAGTYQAVGTWGWSSQSGAEQASAAGPQFAVSSS